MGEPKNIKFSKPELILNNFGNKAGGRETQDKYPRLTADVDGDKRADIIGFGDSGVYVSFSQKDSFAQPRKLLDNSFTYDNGWISQDKYPRFLADVDGDKRADIIGFGDSGVYVSFSQKDSFAQPRKLLESSFTYDSGWISQDKYPRFLADVNGDDKADIVGFGDSGIYVSFADTTSEGVQFKQPEFILAGFGVSSGWESQEKHPRFTTDIDGDKRADIVGLGKDGMRAKFSNGDSFGDEIFLPGRFSLPDWTSLNVQPRTTGDVNNDGKADIIGFTTYGFFLMTSNGRGFDLPYLVNYNFGSLSWGDYDSKPRMLADVNGDGEADIVGFGNDGVYVSFVETVSPAALDIGACERFSPNIEVKCMQHIYNKALSRIDATKMTDEQREQAKQEITSAYESYRQVNSENNHLIDEDKRNKEVIFTKAVEKTEETVRSAEALEKERLAAIRESLLEDWDEELTTNQSPEDRPDTDLQDTEKVTGEHNLHEFNANSYEL